MGVAPSRPFEPNNGIVKWVDRQLPIFTVLHGALVAYPTPKNLNYWWSFGSIAGLLLVVQIITGIVLAMHYTPHALMAFDSVEHIMRDVNYGWLLRYVHANGAAFFFLVVYIHIFRGLYYGSYKGPRELLWMLGLVIFLLMMATAFMGYVLPWGQMSFWAATVITNLFGAIPLVGDAIVSLLWGGFAVDNPTLNRFFSLHYLLPFVIAAVVIMHIWALHIPGSNNPLGIDVQGPQDQIDFHPYHTVKDIFMMSVVAVVFFYFVFYDPNFMGHPDNYIEADAMKTPEHIVPEWYFLPFYAILRSVPDIGFGSFIIMEAKLAGVIAMAASLLLLFALPWLDRSPVRSGTFRPIMKLLFWVLVVDVIILGLVGAKVPDDTAFSLFGWDVTWLIVGQVTTVYYFAYFLVALPLLSKFEPTRPLPESISAAVLPRNAAQ